jgi:hypothetical protein
MGRVFAVAGAQLQVMLFLIQFEVRVSSGAPPSQSHVEMARDHMLGRDKCTLLYVEISE